MIRFEKTVLTASQQHAINGVLTTWQADDDEGCGCRYGLDYLDDWLDGDGRETLLHALDGERGALPAAERYVARVLSANEVAPERPTLTEVAEAVADGRRSLASTLTENWSTSQRCVLALAAGEPGAAEEPYNSPSAAWGRLDDRQRAIVEKVAPDVVARFNLRR